MVSNNAISEVHACCLSQWYALLLFLQIYELWIKDGYLSCWIDWCLLVCSSEQSNELYGIGCALFELNKSYWFTYSTTIASCSLLCAYRYTNGDWNTHETSLYPKNLHVELSLIYFCFVHPSNCSTPVTRCHLSSETLSLKSDQLSNFR